MADALVQIHQYGRPFLDDEGDRSDRSHLDGEGVPVSFSASGHCTLSSDQVRLKRGVGVCRVTAHQDGDSRFQPAEDVTQEFRVRPPRRARHLR